MTRLLGTLRGITGITAVVLCTLIGFIPLLPAALIKLLVPWGPVRKPATRVVLWTSSTWGRAMSSAFIFCSGARIHYDQQMPDNRDGRYILLSNHQSWIDIILLVNVISGSLPFPRFFLKEQLRWLPIVGLACWALDFPFMKRYSREKIRKNPALRHRDFETVQRACTAFRDWPVTIINYAEGTRATDAKRAALHTPYDTLLPPKTGGLALAVTAMGELLDDVLDMTVAYVDTPRPSFWAFACGRIPDVSIRLRRAGLPQDLRPDAQDIGNGRAWRRRFKIWLNELWTEKDSEVTAIQDPTQPQARFAPALFSDARDAAGEQAGT